MPGGRVPKLPEQRRNRTPLRGGEWVRLPATPRGGRVPTLPKSLKLSSATHEWWRGIWRSPVARMWTPWDVPALHELAILRDRLLVDGKASLAVEVRLRSDSYGLTPKGRQQRRWLVVDDLGADQDLDQIAEQRRKAKRRRALAKKLDS